MHKNDELRRQFFREERRVSADRMLAPWTSSDKRRHALRARSRSRSVRGRARRRGARCASQYLNARRAKLVRRHAAAATLAEQPVNDEPFNLHTVSASAQSAVKTSFPCPDTACSRARK